MAQVHSFLGELTDTSPEIHALAAPYASCLDTFPDNGTTFEHSNALQCSKPRRVAIRYLMLYPRAAIALFTPGQHLSNDIVLDLASKHL